MTKPKPLAYTAIIITLLLTAYLVLINTDRIDNVSPEPKPVITQKSDQTLTLQATAFSSYGFDANDIDYGPGYCIISDKSEIPLYSLLEIDQYGEAQAISAMEGLAADEIWLWYNAPSKVDMFGNQEVKVKIIGEGDVPCAIP